MISTKFKGNENMKCQKCGQEVSSQNRFCPQCGSKLEPYFFWDIKVEFNSETMEKSKIVQGEKIVLDSETKVEELKKAESQIISLYSSMNIDDADSIRRIRDQIQEISQRYNIAATIVEELNYRLRKVTGATEKIQTEKSDSNKRNEDTRGIFVEGNYENLKSIIAKSEKRHSVEFWIAFVVSAIILFLEGKVWIKELISSLGNNWALIWRIYDLIMYIFIDAVIVSLVWRVSKNFVYKYKYKISEACVDMIVVNDVQALYNAIQALNIKRIKQVYFNERGCVCVKGRYGTYGFPVEDQKIQYGYGEDKNDPDLARGYDYKGDLEKNTIIISLLKALDYQVPINAYRESKNNRFLTRFGKEITAVIVLTFALLVGGALVQHDFQYVYMVQTACPDGFSNISYKDAFNEYFTDRKWEHFTSTEDQNVVEFTGTGIYDGKESEIKIQFVLTEIDENLYSVKPYTGSADGELLPQINFQSYIEGIFTQYK